MPFVKPYMVKMADEVADVLMKYYDKDRTVIEISEFDQVRARISYTQTDGIYIEFPNVGE